MWIINYFLGTLKPTLYVVRRGLLLAELCVWSPAAWNMAAMNDAHAIRELTYRLASRFDMKCDHREFVFLRTLSPRSILLL